MYKCEGCDNDVRVYGCKYCPDCYRDYGKPVKAEEKVKCPYCDKMVSDVRLDQHIRAKHPGNV